MRKRHRLEAERREWARRVAANPRLWALLVRMASVLGRRRVSLRLLLHAAFRVDMRAYRAWGRSVTGTTWTKGRICPVPAEVGR